MKIGFYLLLALLTVLAVSSGMAKITLMQSDVEFFGRYGFSDSMLIAFGVAQLIGGILLPWKRTRFMGATVTACTFLASLVILFIDGNIQYHKGTERHDSIGHQFWIAKAKSASDT